LEVSDGKGRSVIYSPENNGREKSSGPMTKRDILPRKDGKEYWHEGVWEEHCSKIL
jgi:hypothetical protein